MYLLNPLAITELDMVATGVHYKLNTYIITY